jgi:WD40 repeat protein
MNDETFTPESVDEQVDRLVPPFQEEQGVHPSERVVQRLHSLYEEDLLATEHVWKRLVRYAGEPDLAERQTELLPALSQERTLPLPVVPHGANPSRQQKRPSSRTGQTRFGRRASLLVAVLVMILLVGSLVVVLHERRPNVSTGTRSYTLGQTVYSMTRGSEDPLFESLAWSPDSQRLAVLQYSHQGSDVQIWDATTGGNRVTTHMQNLIYCMVWSPNGKWIALAGLGTDIAIVDAQTGALVHQYSVGTVAERLPAGGGSSRLSALLPASGGPSQTIRSLVWSPNSQWLAVTMEASGNVSIVDAQTGTLIHRFTYGTGYTIDVASWSSDGKYLAASVRYMTTHSLPLMVWVWKMSTSQVVFQQSGNCFEFCGNDEIVWQPQKDNLSFPVWTKGKIPNVSITVWDVARNTLLKQYPIDRSDHFVSSVLVWSPDGTYLAYSGESNVTSSSSADERYPIVVLNVQNNQQVYIYKQHKAPLLALAWSPDGKYIASIDMAAVKVWVAP